MEIDREWLRLIWHRHSGKITGLGCGLFLGLLILILGFFQTMFLLLCMGIGYIVGKKFDDNEDLAEMLDKFLPPGYRRYR